LIPWFVKISVKLVLSRLPISRPFLNRIGIFRHGSMVEPDYAWEIFERHLKLAGVRLQGKSVLELGPGDSVGNGIIAFAMGAERSVLIDAGDWASKSLEGYRRFVDWLCDHLPEQDRLKSARRDWATFEDMLSTYRISYLTEGLGSMRKLPADCIDYCFSEAVLEHVRVDDFSETMRQLRRIVIDGAVGSHVIDYKDHLQLGLNNMRFSRRVWESDCFTRSGFYTNRLRHPDIVDAFRAAGFDVVSDQPVLWDALPPSACGIHPELRRYTADELRIREASIVVRPR